MRKIALGFGWVKNVNNLREVYGKKGVLLSPISLLSLIYTMVLVYINYVIRLVIPHAPMVFSTHQTTRLYLLFTSYTHYPHPLLLSTLKKD